jgi:hypothetical protein
MIAETIDYPGGSVVNATSRYLSPQILSASRAKSKTEGQISCLHSLFDASCANPKKCTCSAIFRDLMEGQGSITKDTSGGSIESSTVPLHLRRNRTRVVAGKG